MDLSVIIVSYNSERTILGCLDSIAKATRGLEKEIILIDNHSTDQTKARIHSLPHPLTLIENGENEGFAKAVNRGLARSGGEFILLINPDVIVKSDSLEPLVYFMRSNAKVGICGCRLLNEDGSLQYSKGFFPRPVLMLIRMFLPRPMRKYRLGGYERVGKCDWVTGAFMMIRNSLIVEVGSLDENYFIYYEDVDYCLRAKKRGWEVYYYPGIIALHLNPHARMKKRVWIEKEIQRSRLYFFKKNHYWITYYLLLLLTSRFPQRSLQGISVGTRSG